MRRNVTRTGEIACCLNLAINYLPTGNNEIPPVIPLFDIKVEELLCGLSFVCNKWKQYQSFLTFS